MTRLAALASLAGLTLASSSALAQVTWRGDFETGDTSQFSYLLNPEIGGNRYLDVASDRVAEGEHACRIELHTDAVWPNGLKRVELQHGPDAGLVAEGTELYFAWSFLVPESLSRDPEQTIGYWESASSYRQLMAFALVGEDLRFSTNLPGWTAHWTGSGVVTPGEWHRIAMHVLWSTDPGVGTVDVWFDGGQVVSGAHAQTLADANPAFVQFGLLRGAIEFADVPVIYVDDAVEGRTLSDVRPAALPVEVLDGGPVDAGASAADAASALDVGVIAREDGGASPVDAGSTAAPAAGCHAAPGGAPPVLGLAALALGLLIRRRRGA